MNNALARLKMRLECFGITNRGMVRDLNEDSFLADEKEGIFLVADGMGGLSKGDVASRIAIETIDKFIKQSRVEDITWPIKLREDYSLEENRILAAISLANWNIYNISSEESNHVGMGTTLAGLLIDGDRVVTANVGDSRVYQIRGKTILQLTEDHSLVMEEVRKGNMTPEEARDHPQKHVINRALGIFESTSADLSAHRVQPQDIYLICSDGLSDMISDSEIMALVQPDRGQSLNATGISLIEAANKKGGLDNVTAVLVAFHE
jgi:protein phosphatase